LNYWRDIQIAMGELMAIHNNEVIALLAEDFDRIAELRATAGGSQCE